MGRLVELDAAFFVNLHQRRHRIQPSIIQSTSKFPQNYLFVLSSFVLSSSIKCDSALKGYLLIHRFSTYRFYDRIMHFICRPIIEEGLFLNEGHQPVQQEQQGHVNYDRTCTYFQFSYQIPQCIRVAAADLQR